MSEKGLDIIIVNWNSGELLRACVNSILNSLQSVSGSYFITIVDNASTDNSLEQISENKYVRIVKNNSNLGYGEACNIGAGYCKFNKLLFLNPDIVLKAEVLVPCINFLDNNPDTGIIGIRHTNDSGQTSPSCSRFLKVRRIFYDLTGLSRLMPGIFKPATLMTDWNHKESAYVDQVMGAFMLVRKKDFIRLEGFDTRFYMYFEDMDLSKRMRDLGLKSYYLASQSLYHKGCGSSEGVKAKRLAWSLQSRILYAKIHLKRIDTVSLLIITFILEPFVRIIYSLVRLRFTDIKDLYKGYRMLAKSIIRK